MERRKLFIYTMSLASGILCAYIMLDKCELIKSVSLVACFFVSFHLISKINEIKKKTEIMAYIFFAIGLLSFTFSHIYFSDYEISAEEFSRIECRAVKVRCFGDSFKIYTDNGILCTYYYSENDDEGKDPVEIIGRKLIISGDLKVPEGIRNPGGFDYRRYLRAHGIKYQMQISEIEMIDEKISLRYRLKRFLMKKRQDFESCFTDDDVRGFVKGVLFGDKSDISDEIYDAFKENGTAHILAVSGLHIGMILAVLRYLSGKRRAMGVEIIISLMMILYGEMTMWNISTVRSVIIMITGMTAFHLGKRFDFLTAVSLSAMIVLFIRPYMLFDAGFQMSYLTVTAIAFAGKALAPMLGSGMAYIVSIQLGMLPYSSYMFNRLNPMSMLINIPVVFIVSVLMPFLLLSLVTGILTGIYFSPLIFIISALSELIIRINTAISDVGKFSADVISPNAGILLWIYILLALICSEMVRIMVIRKEKSKILKHLAAMVIPFMILTVTFYDDFRNDEIVFIDVGQGDCTHIRSGSEDVLIDGGGNDFTNVGKRILRPYLLSQGCSDVDMGIVTHLHKDHYLGMAQLSEIYPVNSIGIPEDYKVYYEDKVVGVNGAKNRVSRASAGAIRFRSKSIIYLNQNSNIRISDDVSIEVLWPDMANSRMITSDDANEHNMVYMINYHGVKIMVTGDLLEEDELKMVQKYLGTDKLKCDILKVAHHGSKSSSSKEFLDAASPKFAVIQAGINNIYGHPHRQTIDRLTERGIPVYRTDRDGAVGIDITRTGKIKVHTMRRNVIKCNRKMD